jgi:hypothetical protein
MVGGVQTRSVRLPSHYVSMELFSVTPRSGFICGTTER